MDDRNFKVFFQRIVNQYELAPDAAAELLRRILEVLKKSDENRLKDELKCEILSEYPEREDKR